MVARWPGSATLLEDRPSKITRCHVCPALPTINHSDMHLIIVLNYAGSIVRAFNC